MLQRSLHRGDGGRVCRNAVDRAEGLQCPDRVDGGGVQADLVEGAILHKLHERWRNIAAAVGSPGCPLQELPLRPQPPKHVWIAERCHEIVGRGAGERRAMLRVRRRVMHHPPEPAMHLVAEWRLVGVALAIFKARGRRVVLDDEVVPVHHPDLAIGADVSLDRRRPLVVACHQTPGHPAAEGSAARRDLKRRHDVAGRFADEGGAVPVFTRIGPGGVEPVACRSSEMAVVIDLPHGC